MKRPSYWPAALLTVAMLTLTALYWKSEGRALVQERQTALDRVADTMALNLQQRLSSYELVLRGVKGIFDAGVPLEPLTYRRYMEALDLSETRPGLQGVNVALHIKQADLAKHIATMRKSTSPDYQVHPLSDKAAYSPIALIEPFSGRNVRALGFDTASNPVALAALQSATDTGTMAMTRRLGLVQDAAEDRPACVMYVPMFSARAPVSNLAERRSASIGWVGGSFRVAEIVQDLRGEVDSEVALSIFDGAIATAQTRLYGPLPDADGTTLRSSRTLAIGGQQWTLAMAAQPAFLARYSDAPRQGITACGVALSLMMGWLVWMLGSGRARAMTAARGMTHELREVQLELESTLDAMPDLVFELDLDGRYHNYRSSRKNLLAAPAQTLRGKLISEVLPPNCAAVCMEALQEAHASGFSTGLSMELELADGSHWFELSVARKQVPVGQAPRFIMVSRDITGRKRMEIALEKSNAQLKLLETCVAQLNDMVVITESEPMSEPGPRIVFVNDAFVRRTGYSRDEVIGKTPRVLQGPKTQPEALARIREALRQFEPVREELINYTKAGQEFWLELVIVPIADERGHFTHWVAVQRDVTMRRQIQNDLLRSEQSLNEAQMLAQIGSYETDIGTGVWKSSPALDQIFGIDADYEKTLESWSSLMVEGARDAMAASYQTAISGDGKFSMDYEIVRPSDGQRRWVCALGWREHGEDGRIDRLKGTVQDITDTKLAQHQLQTSLREKDALLKEVHHRVKNNLQVITSMLRMEGARNGAEGTKSVLRDMQVRIRSMALLHESIYRAGSFAAVDLGAYLRQVATQSFRTLQVQPGLVELELDLGLVQVGLDQAMPCGLMVSELLSNCLKHAFPEGRIGKIRIELQPAPGGGHWRLCVSDNGVGLPADFEARSQGSLGLQLVSGLALQIGGELAVGPAARFCITFPVDPGASAIPA